MPSETTGGSSEDLQLHPQPNQRQIGFWNNTTTPTNGVKEYALGDTSSIHSHTLNRFDVPDNALRRQPPFENNNTTNNNNNFGSANKFNVMAGRGGPADHYENGLFSSSLSDLFTRKLRLSAANNTGMYGHSVGASQYQQQEEEEPFQSLEEIEAQTIGNLLPDDDDLLSGVTDGLDCKVQPGGADDAEDVDFFSSVGGMELGEDGVAVAANGEHPNGEHPSRTLFVRNINSNVEDPELRILFEQYGDIRTLYTACKHRGFVMISYYDIRAARRAMQALQNKPLRRRKLDIHYSIPKENPSDKDINQGSVMIYNIDSNVSNDELRHIFGVYGEVKEIRETPQGSRHKSIEFYDIRAAEAASRELNKSELGGKQMKLESTNPGGSKRLNSPFPELDADEASALLQMCSPSTDFTTDISGAGSNVRVTPGSMDHRSLLGVTAAPGSQLLDAELQHGMQANSFSSIIGVESGGMPSSLQNQLKFNDFRSTPNYHPHSLPEYQDGLTNSILSNSPSNLAARMSERLGNRQFNRIGGSMGRSIDLNDNGRVVLTSRYMLISCHYLRYQYTSKMLLAAIDERHRGTYDFIYLPIDFKASGFPNKCNVGYAFINMTEPPLIVPFFQAFNGKKWEKFNSEKVASLAYARIQGKAALIAHFQNSSLMNEDKRCRPILFHTDGPNAGDQVPFPMGVNVRSRVSKNRNSSNEENQGESSLDVGNGEVSSNGDSSSVDVRLLVEDIRLSVPCNKPGKPITDLSKTGAGFALSFHFGNEMAERMAYFGLSVNMVAFMFYVMHRPFTSSANAVNNFLGISQASSVLGGFIADAYLGRYWTIAIFTTIYLLGLTGITLCATLNVLVPKQDDCSEFSL
ncbi:MEI2-like protein 4, partial [Tanacetum coccineum]